MKSSRLWRRPARWLAVLVLAACSDGAAPDHPLPVLLSISPAEAEPGSGALTLTLHGTGFLETSVVRWNGADRPTTFVSATELEAGIAAADLDAADEVEVVVHNGPPGGGTSGAALFRIQLASAPAPSISALSPDGVLEDAAAPLLTVDGSGFVPRTVIRVNGVARPTTFVNSSRLTTQLQAADVAASGSLLIAVSTSQPGGGASTAMPFTVAAAPAPAPTLSSITPATAPANGLAFALTVQGTNFQTRSIIRVNGAPRPTTFISPTQLEAQLTSVDVSAAGTLLISVATSAPGGGTTGNASLFLTMPPSGTFVVTTLPTGPTWDATIASNGAAYTTLLGVDTIVRIDLAGNAEAGRFFAGAWPYEVIFNGAGTTAYATLLNSNAIAVINASAHARTTTYTTPDQPIRVRLVGARLYVTHVNGAVAILNAATGAQAAPTLSVGGILNGIAVTPAADKVWVANTSGTLREVDVATDALGRTIAMGGVPQDIMISPDGAKLYAANEQGWLGVYRLSDLVRTDSILIGAPFALALNPAGTQLWVSQSVAGEIAILNAATLAPVTSITSVGTPRHIAFAADGTALIADEQGTRIVRRVP